MCILVETNRKANWFLMFTWLQVNWEDNTQCHQRRLLQLSRFRWEQCWFPENCGRHNLPVWGWSLQHKAGNGWVCGHCAVVQRKTCSTSSCCQLSGRTIYLDETISTNNDSSKKDGVQCLKYLAAYQPLLWKSLSDPDDNRLWASLHMASFMMFLVNYTAWMFNYSSVLHCWMNYSTFVKLCTVWA